MRLFEKYMLHGIPREGEGAGAGGAGAGAAGAAGGQAKPWFDGKLDAEMLGHIDNKGWKKDDPIEVAVGALKQARELQKHFGVPETQLLKLPAKPDDEAGWKAVRERLGMPKEAKDYDLTGVKYADGRELEQGFTDTMRAALHKAGVAKDAATDIVKAVVKQHDDVRTAETNERTARITTERAELQKEWGSNWEFNRLTAMQGARRAVGSEEAATKLIDAMQNAIGYKATMEFWRKIGTGTTEDTFIENKGGSNPTTRNGATARLEELKADKAWSARLLAGDATAKREFASLMQLIHGEAA